MIGEVRTVSGTASAIKANGTRVNLTPGTEVDQGDIIETGPGAAVGIVFIDKTVFSLGANARMTLDDLVFNGAGVDHADFNVLTGAFSFVSGEIARVPEAMRVKTRVATIGIRGTQVAGNDELVVLLSQDGHVGSIILNGQVILDQENQVFVAGSGATSFLSPQQVNGLFSGILRLIPLIRGGLDDQDKNVAQLTEAQLASSGGNSGSGLQFEAFERDLVGFGLKITGPLQHIIDALKDLPDDGGKSIYNNHAPKASDDFGAVIEAGGVHNGTAGTSKFVGTVSDNVTDPDGDHLKFAVLPSIPTYGALVLNTATGVWTYTLNNADSDTQALNAGETAAELFTYAVIDPFGASATATITLTITGANDNPEAADTGGSVTEAGGFANFVPGVATVSGNLAAYVSDVDNAGMLTDDLDFQAASSGTYGSLALDSETGAWTYTLNNNDTDTQALNKGETATETFTYTVLDQAGATATATLTVTILGANDFPTANAESGTVLEAGSTVGAAATATGSLTDNVFDVDNAGARTDDLDFTVVGGGTYGSLAYNTETGAWTYTLNNSDADTDSLNAGETATEAFTYVVRDEHGATAASTLTITVIGANDAPTANGESGTVLEMGETVSGSATATGTLADNVSDIDNGGAVTDDLDFSAGTGVYGSLTLNTETGAWTYTLNDSDADTDSLNAGETATETFTYTVTDESGATATSTLTVTITGANDAPTANDETGTVLEAGSTEAGSSTATGSLADNVSDIDNGGTLTDGLDFSVSGAGIYGVLTLDTATGDWTYALNDSDTDTDALNLGETAAETFTYTVVDSQGAEATATLTLTIEGANDAPTANDETGTVLEAGSTEAGSSTATGSLADNVSDIDNGGTLTDGLDFSVSGAGIYGVLTLDTATGDWTYALNDSDTDTDALNLGETAAETFTYTVVDSQGAEATATLTLTIEGSNDAPTAAIVTAEVTEDGVDAVTGTFDASDVDAGGATGDPLTYAVASAVGTYGTLDFDSSTGAWTYTLNESNDALNYLNAGATAAETFDYTVTDASGATDVSQLTITIQGATDAPDFSNLSQDLDWFATGSQVNLTGATNGPDTIIGSTDSDIVDGLQGSDTIVAGAGDDSVQGSEDNDLIFGGSGNDDLVGNAGNDSISGWSGDDSIFGYDDADLLYGGPGDDVIAGGNGAGSGNGGDGLDTLVGGTGNDQFVIDNVNAADVIVDFTSGEDKIDLIQTVFSTLSVGALGQAQFASGAGLTESNVSIVYDTSTGNLYYDSDPGNAGGSVQIATLKDAPALQYTDIQIIS